MISQCAAIVLVPRPCPYITGCVNSNQLGADVFNESFADCGIGARERDIRIFVAFDAVFVCEGGGIVGKHELRVEFWEDVG